MADCTQITLGAQQIVRQRQMMVYVTLNQKPGARTLFDQIVLETSTALNLRTYQLINLLAMVIMLYLGKHSLGYKLFTFCKKSIKLFTFCIIFTKVCSNNAAIFFVRNTLLICIRCTCIPNNFFFNSTIRHALRNCSIQKIILYNFVSTWQFVHVVTTYTIYPLHCNFNVFHTL